LPEFRVPPGCTGFQMEAGGRYDASRTGKVTVDSPADAAALRKAAAASGGMLSEAVHAGTVGGPSRECPVCRFVGYLWQSGCPKGHGPMPLKVLA
jgi:hypothetical protein